MTGAPILVDEGVLAAAAENEAETAAELAEAIAARDQARADR